MKPLPDFVSRVQQASPSPMLRSWSLASPVDVARWPSTPDRLVLPKTKAN